MFPLSRIRKSTTDGTGLPPKLRGARSSRRLRISPINPFFTKEFGTNWCPEAMPSYSWTGTAGKALSRHAKLPRGDRWETCNFGENSGVIQDGAVRECFLLAWQNEKPQGIRQPILLNKLSQTSKAPRIALWRAKRAARK
jgi:hypothetical protein